MLGRDFYALRGKKLIPLPSFMLVTRSSEVAKFHQILMKLIRSVLVYGFSIGYYKIKKQQQGGNSAAHEPRTEYTLQIGPAA